MYRQSRIAAHDTVDSPARDREAPHDSLRLPGPACARRAVRVAGLTGLLVWGAASRGLAYPGQVDESFAGLSAGSVGENVMCHAVAPDGKLVFAGTSGIALLIVRRLSNGEPDPSFGGDGSVVVTNLQYSMVAKSVAVQADGKIVVAGYISPGSESFLVARVTTSGSPDPTFSGDGFATTDISVGGRDLAEKVLIQPDGKIVAVGSAFLAGDWDFAAARYHPDGTLDATFSGDGKASIGFGGNEECFDAVLQADGKLVMAGSSEDLALADKDFAVCRLHPSGALDGSFDGDGKLKTGFGGIDVAYAVAIQPADLRIVVAGRYAMARYYSSDGSLDGTFAGDGKLGLPITAYDAAVTPGGRITLIGRESDVVRALRMNFDGSFDPEWQGDGDVSVDSGTYEEPSLSLLADGRVLTVVPKGADCGYSRYWADGNLDVGGRQALAFDDATFPAGSLEVADDMAVLADGRIVLAGTVTTAGYTETDFALARFLPDGRLDTSFGVNGRVALSLGQDDVAKAMRIQPDGKIVVAGYTGSGNAMNFMIARFNANGSLDPTFAFGGFNVMDFAGGADQGWALALQPDGKIVVAGTVFNGTRNVYGVARFLTDGTADPTFDGDGRKLFEFSGGLSHFATSVVVQAGGRIVVGGSVGANFALVGFTTSGAVDTFFGTFGITTRDLGGSDYLETMVMGTDNRIYAAGARVTSGNDDWVLSRWPASAGAVLCNPVCPWTTAFEGVGSSGWVDAMDVRSDGHIVVAGMVGSVARWAQFAPGSNAPNAIGQVYFPGSGTTGLAVRFAGLDKILLAGSHFFQGDRNMTLTRFEAIPNTTVSVDESAPVGPTLRLQAPFPNPLAGRSSFAFELPTARSVRLAIHDVSGRQVRLLQDGELVAGRHSRAWDGSDDHGHSAAPGMYFARLVAGGERATASIVVLR